MAELLSTLQSLFTTAFVVTSMLVMGLSLTVPQILEPLRNVRLVVVALLAAFVILPVTAVVLKAVIPMDEQLQIGLILLATAHGAPFLPKLSQIANGNLAFAVGLMTVLIVATVIYLPIVLPFLLPGVTVDAGAIAGSLFVQMIVPLAAGLLVNARWSEAAAEAKPPIAQVSNISLALLLVLMLGLNLPNVIGLIGSGALLATLILTVVAIGSGYLLGGPGQDTRGVTALGLALPNLAAGFLIAGSSFADKPNVLVFLAGAGLIVLLINFPLAAELGKRSANRAAAAGAPVPSQPPATTRPTSAEESAETG
jgi:predicted Na+-dependent transporter